MLTSMAHRFGCPHVGVDVELTDERETHIRLKHESALAEDYRLVRETLLEPDLVRHSKRDEHALLFSRWYDETVRGKHMVVVVVSDAGPPTRHWIVTAYLAKRLAEGTIEWQRS